jgi:hypothetical protein
MSTWNALRLGGILGILGGITYEKIQKRRSKKIWTTLLFLIEAPIPPLFITDIVKNYQSVFSRYKIEPLNSLFSENRQEATGSNGSHLAL